MIKLLKFEFRKIFKQKTIYIIGAVALILMTFVMASEFASSPADMSPSPITLVISAISSSMLTIFTGAFTAIFICEDTSNNTLKNIYAKGYTRTQVFFSKSIAAFSATFILAVAVLLYAYLFGMTVSSETDYPPGNIFANVMAQIVLLLAYQALFIAVDTISGRLSFSLIFNLLGNTLIVEVFTLMSTALGSDKLSFDRYWIDEPIAELTSGCTDTELLTKSFVMGAVYITLFLAFGFIFNRKKEIA